MPDAVRHYVSRYSHQVHLFQPEVGLGTIRQEDGSELIVRLVQRAVFQRHRVVVRRVFEVPALVVPAAVP